MRALPLALTPTWHFERGTVSVQTAGLIGRLVQLLGRPVTSAPSLNPALQQQLCLRRESGREPVEVIVIDAAAPPREQ